jgi:hypothetical protein
MSDATDALRTLQDVLAEANLKVESSLAAWSFAPVREPVPSPLLRDRRVIPNLTGSSSDLAPWGQLPPQLRREMEKFSQDQFLPKYQAECERFYRAITDRDEDRN